MSHSQQEDSDVSGRIDRIVDLAKSMSDGTMGAREELVATCRSLLDVVESPRERIWRTWWAEPTHHLVIRIASELKIWEHLAADEGSPKTSEQLASMCSADPFLVRRMLKHLAAMGTVKESDVDTFANTPMSSLLAREEYFNSNKLVHDTILITHHGAVDYLRQRNYQCPNDIRDSIFQYAHNCKGQTFFEWGTTHGDPPVAFQFGQMLTAWSQDRKHWMDPHYYPVEERLARGVKSDEGAVLLVDVGGSHGHDLEQFNSKHPHIPGSLILQDQPEIISQVKPSARIEPMVHDFLTPQPIQGARAYYMHSILHDWNEDDCRKILGQLKPALESGYSKILIQEMVVPDRGAHWQLTSLDWELMTHFGGHERTESEWRNLIESAGLKVSGIYKHPQSQDSLIEVELP